MSPNKPKRVIINTRRVNGETVVYSHIYVLINPILVCGSAPEKTFSPSDFFAAPTELLSFDFPRAVTICDFSRISQWRSENVLFIVNPCYLYYARDTVVYTSVFWRRRNRIGIHTIRKIWVIPRINVHATMVGAIKYRKKCKKQNILSYNFPTKTLCSFFIIIRWLLHNLWTDNTTKTVVGNWAVFCQLPVSHVHRRFSLIAQLSGPTNKLYIF